MGIIKKLFFYSIVLITIATDMLFVIWAFMHLIQMQCTSIERIFGIIFYGLFCIILLILTTDVMSWVEKQLHD